MPISSIEQARDLIIGQFLDEWNTLASPPKVLYADRVGEPPDESEAWARISVQHSLASQVTLGGPAGKRFRRFGTVLVNILTPYGEGLTTSDVLVQKAVDAFEGRSTSPDEVRFLNTSFSEIGPDGAWFRTNVQADFEYDLIK